MKQCFAILLFSLSFASPLAAEGGPPRSGSGAPTGERRKPPQEAITACAGKKATDACSFAHDGKQRTGTCFSPQADKPLACRPAPPVR